MAMGLGMGRCGCCGSGPECAPEDCVSCIQGNPPWVEVEIPSGAVPDHPAAAGTFLLPATPFDPLMSAGSPCACTMPAPLQLWRGCCYRLELNPDLWIMGIYGSIGSSFVGGGFTPIAGVIVLNPTGGMVGQPLRWWWRQIGAVGSWPGDCADELEMNDLPGSGVYLRRVDD